MSIAPFNSTYTFGLDPVTCKQMTDPVIDQAGHTFDRSTIEALFTKVISEGQQMICPIGKEVIFIDRLVPNLLAKEGIEKTNSDKAIVEAAQTELSRLDQIADRLKNMESDRARLESKIDNLTEEVRVSKKQVQNTCEMSVPDRRLVAVGSGSAFDTDYELCYP